MLKKEMMHDGEMTVGDVGEAELVEFLEPYTSGIGDDCGWIEQDQNQGILVSSDALIENIHFLRSSPAAWVGQKALRVNASDIAASGGRPKWATLALSLPGDLPVSWFEDFILGFSAALQSYDVAWVGGDITAAPKHIAMTVTIFGNPDALPNQARQKPCTRLGAKPGDVIAVTGCLGETLPGLQSILEKRRLEEPLRQFWEKRHFHPPNRVAFAATCHANGLVTAMMDLSDGLAVDSKRLAQASGIKLEIDIAQLPLSAEFLELGYDCQDAALAGEDFELLMTVSPYQRVEFLELAKKQGVPVRMIGRVLPGSEVVFLKEKKPVKFRKNSWHHF